MSLHCVLAYVWIQPVPGWLSLTCFILRWPEPCPDSIPAWICVAQDLLLSWPALNQSPMTCQTLFWSWPALALYGHAVTSPGLWLTVQD